MVYIGNSLYDEEGAKIVKEMAGSATAQCVELVLPVDLECGEDDGDYEATT